MTEGSRPSVCLSKTSMGVFLHTHEGRVMIGRGVAPTVPRGFKLPLVPMSSSMTRWMIGGNEAFQAGGKEHRLLLQVWLEDRRGLFPFLHEEFRTPCPFWTPHRSFFRELIACGIHSRPFSLYKLRLGWQGRALGANCRLPTFAGIIRVRDRSR